LSNDFIGNSHFFAPFRKAIATPDSHVLSSLRVTIIKTQWNASLIDPLAERVENKLVSCGVPADFITVVKAPGAYELHEFSGNF